MIYLYVILGALLRRTFGGWLESYPVIKERGVQTVLMICIMATIFNLHYDWIWSFVFAGVFQIFWAMKHVPIFWWDKDNNNPNEEDQERYSGLFEWLTDLVIKDSKKYYRIYDFTWVLFRYTIPTLPLIYVDWKFVLIGLSIAPIYLLCDWLNIKGIKILGQTDTHLAEFVVGAVVYGGSYLIMKGI